MSTLLEQTQQLRARRRFLCVWRSFFVRVRSLSDQVALINGLDASKAGGLLSRVISKLAEKVWGRGRKEGVVCLLFSTWVQHAVTFNEAEVAKLCAVFRIEQQQVEDMVETCGYVFEQAAFAVRLFVGELQLAHSLGGH